jgi:DNA polymerase elongation subunit (family B)
LKKNSKNVKKIHEIPYDGYVYDLTTENHHFAAGVGNMIVHNTDSVFFTFNLENPETGEKISGKPALEMTIEIAQDAAKLCSQWLKPPMDLAYEKTLMPFILLSKKRYVGMLYEDNPNKGKMKYMGLSLKRRDSCDYLKDTYGGILNILMKEHDIQKSIDFLNDSLTNLIKGNVTMDKLMITKALRGYYKNPNTIAHKVLADRIGQRDPGNKPKPGDRMRFVHIVNNNKKALQGEKIETPEFIIDKKLPIDYTFYITNQLMKPLQQLFGLALEQIWNFQGKTSVIKKFKEEVTQLEKEYPDLETFMKKREKLCSTKIKVILFDKFLTKIFNDKNGIKEISSYFVKK